ncbi:MAG: hypothetical protein VYE73_07335 [Acidobacteriota bacterium]|nr:hypothetical protein [Acidobacteriota bacterium]
MQRRAPRGDAVTNPVDTTMALALTPAEVSLRAFFDPHGERVYG